MLSPLVTPDYSRNSKLTEFGKTTLQDRYQLEGEDFQDTFARVASAYSNDKHHAQRIYDYISNLWFMPATPVLSNGGTTRAFPISCFLTSVDDSLAGIFDTYIENAWLSAGGGGIGTYWGNIREVGSRAGHSGKTSGMIPFMKVQDSLTMAVSQGSVRNGSAAVYLPIWHPEINEFLEIRKPEGDLNRKSLFLHHGICIDDAFMQAVEAGDKYALRSILTGEKVDEIDARSIWIKILRMRGETGEPYLFFSDNVDKGRSEVYKALNTKVVQSNLCTEIFLSTGKDYLENWRSAVCCLSSLNLEKWDEWNGDDQFILDVMYFLDNVLQDFISRSGGKKGFEKARYSAMMERSVGLGVMGFHSYLQSKGIAFESPMAKGQNLKIFRHIKQKVDAASKVIAQVRGSCPDAIKAGIEERFSNKIAIAPTASISIICGGTSPGIEPFPANHFIQKTLSGTNIVRNKHLEKILEEKGKNTKEIWDSIVSNHGSVNHLDFLFEYEKEVFKTAFEIDQRWVVDFSADRQQYIDQGQSVNLFFLADADKAYIHRVHMDAWKKGLKSLYYYRSKSLKRAKANFDTSISNGECLACQ